MSCGMRRKFSGVWYYHYKHCTEKVWAEREAAYLRKNGNLARFTPAWEVWRREK